MGANTKYLDCLENHVNTIDVRYHDGTAATFLDAGHGISKGDYPLDFTVSNNTSFAVKNIRLFNTPGFNPGIQIRLADTVIAYERFMRELESMKIGLTHLISTDHKNLFQPIMFHQTSENGNHVDWPVTPILDVNLNQSGITAIKQKYLLSKRTNISFSMQPHTTMKIRLYPMQEVNVARGIKTRPKNELYGVRGVATSGAKKKKTKKKTLPKPTLTIKQLYLQFLQEVQEYSKDECNEIDIYMINEHGADWIDLFYEPYEKIEQPTYTRWDRFVFWITRTSPPSVYQEPKTDFQAYIESKSLPKETWKSEVEEAFSIDNGEAISSARTTKKKSMTFKNLTTKQKTVLAVVGIAVGAGIIFGAHRYMKKRR